MTNLNWRSLERTVLEPQTEISDRSAPAIEVVSPFGAGNYYPGVYRGRSDVLVCSEPLLFIGISRLYLHIREGGILDNRHLPEILETSREKEIMLIGDGSTEPQRQRLRALSAQYFVPVLIVENRGMVPIHLQTVVDRAISGKSHEEIVRELGARQYL